MHSRFLSREEMLNLYKLRLIKSYALILQMRRVSSIESNYLARRQVTGFPVAVFWFPVHIYSFSRWEHVFIYSFSDNCFAESDYGTWKGRETI